MSTNNKTIPAIKDVKTIKVVRSKGPTLKDPIRFPKIIDPMEKKFTDDYLKMMNSMTKMLQIELLNQVR